MEALGVMSMPSNFRYRDVFLHGRPQHAKFDEFGARHPKMTCAKRAKIFSPFDALRGFNEAVASKDILYVNQIELGERDKDEIDRRLNILHNLTFNSRMAKANRVLVTVRFYVPCDDKNNFAYGQRGLYEMIEGICWNVDSDITKTIHVGSRTIHLEHILSIESPIGVFEQERNISGG